MKGSLKKSQPLQYSYLREVVNNLCALRSVLDSLRSGADVKRDLAEIQERTRRISDLAMVHGFEGVEVVAAKLSSKLKQHLSCESVDPVLLFKIESSVKAIQTVLKIEEVVERGMTVECINRSAEINQKKVENCAREVIQGLESKSGNEEVSVVKVEPSDPGEESETEELFDISEFSAVNDLFEAEELRNGHMS